MTLSRVICRHKARKAVKIPKAKNFTEGDIISALRSTVPRPTLALPWAEGCGENFLLITNQTLKAHNTSKRLTFHEMILGRIMPIY